MFQFETVVATKRLSKFGGTFWQRCMEVRMWNLLRAKKETEHCRSVHDALENAPNASALSSSQRAHLSVCSECQKIADHVSLTRRALQEMPRVAQHGSWFAPRVMAALAARESDLRKSIT